MLALVELVPLARARVYEPKLPVLPVVRLDLAYKSIAAAKLVPGGLSRGVLPELRVHNLALRDDDQHGVGPRSLHVLCKKRRHHRVRLPRIEGAAHGNT